MPHLNILCSQVKLPVPGMDYMFVIDQPKESHKPFKHYSIFPMPMVTFHNLMVILLCQRQHLLMSLNTEKSSWYLTSTFTSTDQHSQCKNVLWTRTKEKSNHHYNLPRNPEIYHSDQSVKYTYAILAQVCFKDMLHIMELILDTDKVAENLRLDRPWALGQTYCYYCCYR